MSCRRSTSPKGTGFLASRAWPSPRCEQAIDAEIDAEQVLAQIERGDGGHREANRECEARVLAGVHEREAEGREAQGFTGFTAKPEPQLDSIGRPTHQPMSTAAAIVTARQ